VWFDAPIDYIIYQRMGFTRRKRMGTVLERSRHKVGSTLWKDNMFHCIIFPAMLKAEGSYILPDNVPANEFLNLEGNKLSTSKNWAVWLHEYLEDFQVSRMFCVMH
jgi:methionyl-tRNA synthetase